MHLGNLSQIALITNIEDTLLSSKQYIEQKCFEYFAGYMNHSNDD